MRKTRSDKGTKRGPRDPFKVNSQSSDSTIKRMLNKVNSVIDTYRIEATDKISNDDAAAVVDYTAGKVQSILRFDVKNEGINMVDNHIPVNDESVKYIKDVLKRQEDAEAKQKEAHPDFVAGKKINELLKSIPTFSKKIDQIQQQLEDTQKFKNLSGVTLQEVPEGAGHRKAIWANREAATLELVARATQAWKDIDLGDVIDKLYEDKYANADIIDDLSAGKWDGELLERANLRYLGLDTDEEEEEYNPFAR